MMSGDSAKLLDMGVLFSVVRVLKKRLLAMLKTEHVPPGYETTNKLGIAAFLHALDDSTRNVMLVGERFSHGHLAQLKFILPEVIEIKKVLVHDERTCCMKPDLHVTMNVDAIKNEGMLKLASGNSHMRKVFQGRLLDFFKAHHEVPYITTALMDAKRGTEGRKDLFDWLSRQLSGLSNFPDARENMRKDFKMVDSMDTIELPIIDFDKILVATDNFSTTNKLGEGGFGPVYKGRLEDGHQVAVKRLSRHLGQGVEEFKNEIVLISKLQHWNLVRLLGCCIEGEEKLLVGSTSGKFTTAANYKLIANQDMSSGDWNWI
ncbi:hypothetical protein HYC85_017802 [Camellia sinensis]|uniref:non-specific serine/threonine protein kinase n=1 Tax=Camellia sinensis TaxID=4442 RepID=A0A7J7GU44_CAMSI|nr:hypothetical protein HYC85_017802 [Camellia sinensis]